MLLRLRMLRCPAQWDGYPIWGCSSKTVALMPNLAKFKAAYEPTGPAPMIMASGAVPVNCLVCVVIVTLLLD